MFSERRGWRRRARTGVLLSETEDSCLFCDEFSCSSSPVAYVRMRHLMNHYVERHGFRLDPRGTNGDYLHESPIVGPMFFRATRRKLKEVDAGRRAALEWGKSLSRPLRSNEALIFVTDEMGHPVSATVCDVSDLVPGATR
jgi:hypothetical protein